MLTTIIIISVLALAIIVLLVWLNIRDEQDTDPQLTDELEKIKQEQDKLK